MKRFNLLTLMLAFCLLAAAQNNFMVYSFKGNVSVVENKVETKVKVGKALSSTANIKVAANSMVTLIYNETAMFSIRAAGTYMLGKMNDSCKVSGSSVSANYVKFIWSQMTMSGGSAGSNRKAFMSTVGAVTRSVNPIWIDPRLDTVNYSGGEFPLSWKCYSDAKEYEFTLFSMVNTTEPTYKTTVQKLKIPIPSFTSKIKPGNTYYWTAAIKGEENEELKVFNYVPQSVFEEVLNKFKNQSTAFEGPAEQAYRIAFMLEDAHFLAEAYQYYLKASSSAADNPLYRSTLMSFRKDYEIK